MTGWSLLSRPEFELWYEDSFFPSADGLSDAERRVLPAVMDDLRVNGPGSGDVTHAFPPHGSCRFRLTNGVVILYAVKLRGPQSISLLRCGRYRRSGDGELAMTIL